MPTVYSVFGGGDLGVYRQSYPAITTLDGGSPWVSLASDDWVLSGITLDDAGNVYVFAARATGQARVYKITGGGSASVIYDDAFSIGMAGPGGVEWNPVDGLLYVWDAANHFVSMTTAGGSVTLIDTGYLVLPAPSGIRCTPDGAVWFVNSEGSSGTSPAINRYDPDTGTFAEAHGVGSILTEPGDPLPRADGSVWHTLAGVGHSVSAGFVDSTISCLTDDPPGVDFADMRAWYRNGVGVICDALGDFYEVGSVGCPVLLASTDLFGQPNSFAVDGLGVTAHWRVGRIGWPRS